MTDEAPLNTVETTPAGVNHVTEIVFKEVEVARLNLQKNDVLVVKMKGSGFDRPIIASLRDHFKKVFPANKVLVFALGEDNSMDMEVIQAELLQEPVMANYCSDCDCGKTEAAETVPEPPQKPVIYRMSPGQLVKVIEQESAVFGETGAIENHLGNGFYLVRFQSVGVIKMNGLALEEIKENK